MNADHWSENKMGIYEEIETLRGRKVKRIKSSVFYWSGLGFLALGITLVTKEIWGGGVFLIVTLFPCLMLYPLVRFLFGGKDSLGAVVTTVVVEEVLKNRMSNVKKTKKRRH